MSKEKVEIINIMEHELKPFIKWVGGKRNVINNHLKKYFPKSFDTYIEPFVGGGAVLFYLQPQKAIVNDLNQELITSFKVIKNDCKSLIRKLNKYKEKHSEVFYYETREKRTKKDVEIAARFIYLNKTCFNGLYRVNSQNKFNVPFNKKTKEKLNLFDQKNLENISFYLNSNSIELYSEDFEKIIDLANANDFVFCDPPYDYEKSGFDSYTKNSFGKKGQIRLANALKRLNDKNVKWMLTNHNTALIKELYQEFCIIPIKTNRNINSVGNKRKGYGNEVVVINYEK